MMTSQARTRLIEKYLIGNMSLADKLLFEAKLIIDPIFKREFYFQKKTHFLIKMYHREQLKEELEILHQKIFRNPDKIDLQLKIYQLFK